MSVSLASSVSTENQKYKHYISIGNPVSDYLTSKFQMYFVRYSQLCLPKLTKPKVHYRYGKRIRYNFSIAGPSVYRFGFNTLPATGFMNRRRLC